MKEQYPIFVHWYHTLDWILSAAERFPKNARFSLASRLTDLALDMMERIVDAIYTSGERRTSDSFLYKIHVVPS